MLTQVIVAVLFAIQPLELNDSNYLKWRDYLVPKISELEWKAIPWRASLWSAVLEGNKQDKPILLWAMNGHPLGAT